jgi:hypothetical protein
VLSTTALVSVCAYCYTSTTVRVAASHYSRHVASRKLNHGSPQELTLESLMEFSRWSWIVEIGLFDNERHQLVRTPVHTLKHKHAHGFTKKDGTSGGYYRHPHTIAHASSFLLSLSSRTLKLYLSITDTDTDKDKDTPGLEERVGENCSQLSCFCN